MKSTIYIVALLIVGLITFYTFLNNKSNSIQTMDSQNLKETIKNNPGTIIDVRTLEEYEQGHLKLAAHNYDFLSGEFEEKLDSLDKDQTYYLYCRSGNRSGKAAKVMKENGFKDAQNIGGYEDLVNQGFEAE